MDGEAALGDAALNDHDPSGRSLAEAAYEAGAVEPIERIALQDVTLSFVFAGTQEQAKTFALGFTAELLAAPQVEEISYQVTDRTA